MVWNTAYGTYSRSGAPADVAMVGSPDQSIFGLDLTRAKQAGHGRGIQFTSLNNEGTQVRVEISLIGMSEVNLKYNPNQHYVAPDGVSTSYATGWDYGWFVEAEYSTNNGASWTPIISGRRVASHPTPMNLAYEENNRRKHWSEAHIEYTTTLDLPNNYTHVRFEIRGDDPAQRNKNIYSRQIIVPPKVYGTVSVTYQGTDGRQLGTDNLRGEKGTNYQVAQRTFTKYRFVRAVGSPSGQFGSGNQNVTMLYEYVPDRGSVTAQYIGDNGEILATLNFEGTESETYNVPIKQIANYTHDRTEGSLTGTYGSSNRTVKIYYRKNQRAVTVNYLDEATKQPIKDPTSITKKVDEAYTVDKPAIDNFTFSRHEGQLTGKMPANGLTVNLYYRRNQRQVSVRVVDIKTGKELQPSKSLNVGQGLPYTVDKPTIKGFTFQRNEGNLTGTMPNGNLSVTLFYKKDREPDRPRPYDNLEPIVKTIVEEIPPSNKDKESPTNWADGDCVLCKCEIIDTQWKIITTTIKINQVITQGEVVFNPKASHRITIGDPTGEQEIVDAWVDFDNGDRINLPINGGKVDTNFVPDSTNPQSLKFIGRGRPPKAGTINVSVDGANTVVNYKENITQSTETTHRSDACQPMHELNDAKLRQFAVMYRDLQTCNLAEEGAKGFYNVWCMFENMIEQMCDMQKRLDKLEGRK